MNTAFYTSNINRTICFLRILLVWVSLSCLMPKANGQQTSQAFFPAGSTITLDTITFAPNQALPFDRYFYLVVTQPATTTVDRFAITPIDKQGRNDFRKRDLNIFLRSKYQDKKGRDKFKEPFPKKPFFIKALFLSKSKRNSLNNATLLSNIRKNPFFETIPVTKKISKDKKADLYLRIMPLDPGREYTITLIGGDNEAFNDVFKISSKIIKSKLEPDPVEAGSLSSQAAMDNIKSILKTNKRNVVDFDRGDIEIYEKRLSRFTLNLYLNKKELPEKNYLFLVPEGDNLLSLSKVKSYTSLVSNKLTYSSADSTKPPQVIAISSETIKDYKGNKITPFQVSNYTLQLYSVYKDSDKNELIGLGELALVKDTDGFTYKFAASQNGKPEVFIELNKSNPLARFSTINSTLASLAKLPTFLESGCSEPATLRFLLTKASVCPCEEKGIKDLTQKDDLMRTISLLYDNNSTIIKSALQGLVSLKEPAADLADEDDYKARSANLVVSISLLDDLMEFARKAEAYNATESVKINTLLLCLQALRDDNLVMAKAALDKIVDTQVELQEEFKDGFGLITTQSITQGSTSVLNLVSETKFRIIPDFGFVALFKGDKLYTFQDFTPYLGFQVGFRPIDKDIPFRMVHNKSLWHRLSFMSGITLRSLKIENQREDFFASNSLITGLGFRINNWLRFTSGTVWFKGVDPNQLSANKPIRFSPFLGLSIDLELQDIFGGIAKLFKP